MDKPKFMNDTSQTVAMTYCINAAKNKRLQIVLGRSVITGGIVLFNVGVLRLADVNSELYYCINNRASDIAVLKLCSGITISKLLVLLEQGSEDSMNIAFIATSLYFLNTFLCSHNTDNTTSEGCVTVLWIDIFSFSFLVLCMFSIRFNIVQNT